MLNDAESFDVPTVVQRSRLLYLLASIEAIVGVLVRNHANTAVISVPR